MSSKSEIYVTNTTTGTSIEDGGIYTPTTIVRRFGRYTNLTTGGVVIGNPCDKSGSRGYYNINVDATVTAGAAGTVTATVYEDGVAMPGATASQAAASGSTVTLNITTAVARLTCSNPSSIITVVISGVATTSENLAIRVEKV